MIKTIEESFFVCENKTKQQLERTLCVMLQLVSAMAERRRMGYSVNREIMDEGEVDEVAEKSDSKTSLSERVKKSMR